jgi:hypothetical protein
MQRVIHAELPLTLQIEAAEEVGAPVETLSEVEATSVEQAQRQVEAGQVVGGVDLAPKGRGDHHPREDRRAQQDQLNAKTCGPIIRRVVHDMLHSVPIRPESRLSGLDRPILGWRDCSTGT